MGALDKIKSAIDRISFGGNKVVIKKEASAYDRMIADKRDLERDRKDLDAHNKALGFGTSWREQQVPSWLAAAREDEKANRRVEQLTQRDKKHAEHGLKNIAQGKTLESEVKEVLKMGSKARHEYYTEVLKSGGRKSVDELTSAVKKQRTKSNSMEM